ncbi:MAG TPA: hypothetical protein VFR72_01765 [Gemmatimonadales bacterium]|jgi:hypothetical protein|nr:hypothetical protein [Gemmatimonadales bacterium]
MGCITAPFKLLGCLGLIIALGLAYLYRDRLEVEGRRIIERIQGVVPSSEGRPELSSLESATAKVDSLNGWRADSVVLSPSEFASLVGNGMDRELRSRLDSLEVELLDGEIQVSARLRTDRLPREITGPLGAALRPTEPVSAAGPVRVTRPGMGEWSVRSFRIGEFPVPDEMVPSLVGRALGHPDRKSVPVKVPEGIRSIRVRPGAATLYGATPS